MTSSLPRIFVTVHIPLEHLSPLDGIAEIRTYPERVVWPGLAISLTVLSVNYIGDGLRDALDPRIRGR